MLKYDLEILKACLQRNSFVDETNVKWAIQMEKSHIGTKKSLWKMIKHSYRGATELSDNSCIQGEQDLAANPPRRLLLLLNNVLPDEILLIIL